MTNLNDKLATSSKRFKTAYKNRPSRVRISFTGLGRTKQAHKAECDINTIMAKYQRTGVLDFAQKMEARYADCTGIDFQSAQLIVAQAQSMFAELPSSLRDRFENDPAQFLAFVQNDKNREEAQELGLLREKAPLGTGEAAQGRREPAGRKGGSTPPSKDAQAASEPHRSRGGEGGETNTST